MLRRMPSTSRLGMHAGVEAAGAEDDQVGLEDRADGFRVGGRVVRQQVDFLDAARPILAVAVVERR